MNSHDPHDPRDAEKASFQDQAERFSRRFSDSAQQVWLAGLGALGRAQAEGGRFFDTLVKEGEVYEAKRRDKAEAQEPGWRDNVEEQLQGAREKASGTWDKVGQAFEDQVQGALKKLHVPGAEDIAALNARIDALTTRLNRLESRQNHPAGSSTPDAEPPASDTLS